ncbi:MAG: trypco2 family protein [Cyanobacteria bacterium P01_A01_bin.68]
MPNENLIGLTELIKQVKQELLTTSPENENDIPFLSVDSVELELQVTVKNEGNAGIKIYVLELGGKSSQDDVQKVKVKLSPLLTKEQLLAVYGKKYPERWKELLETSIEGGIKGNEQPGF